MVNNKYPGLYSDKEYVNMYYKIEVKSTIEENEYYEKMCTLFESIGWDKYKNHDTDNALEVVNGKQHLWITELTIGGLLLRDNVKKLYELLDSNDMINIYGTELCASIYDITDQEYANYLDEQKDTIKSSILIMCQPSKKSKFYKADDVIMNVSDEFMLIRLAADGGRNYDWGFIKSYMNKIIDNMIEEKILITDIDPDGKKLIKSKQH